MRTHRHRFSGSTPKVTTKEQKPIRVTTLHSILKGRRQNRRCTVSIFHPLHWRYKHTHGDVLTQTRLFHWAMGLHWSQRLGLKSSGEKL
jgi:hypothetical protein